MSKILTTHEHRTKSGRAVTRERKKVPETVHTQPISSSFATTLDNSTKSNVSQSFVKPPNYGIDNGNATKINRHSESSAQVRQTNEEMNSIYIL